jgi:hypothetical protein
MKIQTKLIIHCTTLLVLQLFPYSSFSQWQLGGNTDALPPPQGLLSNSNFFGGTQTANVRLGTGGISRIFIGGPMYINPGYIGIGSGFVTPQFRFHVFGDGGILSTGNVFGAGITLPAGLTGPRFIWYPRKAAFRAGDATGAIWDDINVGNYSAVFEVERINNL